MMNAPAGVGLTRLPAVWGPALARIWAVVGPLVGVVLGGYLTLRIQRRRWVLDNRKEEYRELLSALNESFAVILDSIRADSTEEQLVGDRAHWKVMSVIGDRLFISDEVKKLDLMKRWQAAVREFNHGGTRKAFAHSFGEIASDVLKSAKSITH